MRSATTGANKFFYSEDRERVKQQAQQNAQDLYDQHYDQGGYDQPHQNLQDQFGGYGGNY